MLPQRWVAARISVTLAFASAAISCVSAQSSTTIELVPPAHPFVCRTWRVEEGLPQDSVWAIVQTRDGYLWIGTGGGLARFDGVRFEVFGMNQGLPSLHVRSLLEDRHGALWIGTAGGLCRLSDGRFTTWTAHEGLAGDSITQLAEDGDGVIWIGTTTGLSRWQDNRFETVGASSGLTDRDVRSLAVDRGGALWISLVNQGLLRQDGGRFVSPSRSETVRNARPFRILCDPAGRIWTTGLGQLVCVDGSSVWSYGAQDGLPEVMITCLAASGDGTIWAGTADLGLYFLRDGRFHAVRRTDGLSDEAVRVVMEDREGNLWVGTRSGGLNRLRPAELTTRQIWDGATEVQPLSLAESADGLLWVGTIGHGLYRLTATQQETILRDELKSNYQQVGSVLIARDGSLWCGGGTTVFHLRDGRVRSWRRGSIVRCLYEDREAGLWVGCQDGTLKLLENGEFRDYSTGLPRTQVTTLAQARDGALWIGCYGGGLLRLKGTERTLIGKPDGLRSDLIRTLCLDSNGILWIGTEGGGLARLQEGRVVSFGKAEGLPDDTILQVLDDAAGNLWLGSHHGIFRVSHQQLDELAAGKAARLYPRVFGRDEGMLSEQCAGGSGTCLKTAGGLLCFSTGGGIVVIDPKPPSDNRSPPTVRLEEVRIGGRLLQIESEQGSPPKAAARTAGVRIPPGQQRFEFHYTGLYFTAPHKVRFRYRMEGLDADWVEAGATRTAHYSFVPPGHYRFEVTAHNGDGVWITPAASVALTVLPHFWQTWWFLSLAVVGLVGAAAGTARYVATRKVRERMRRLELAHAMERERARIARDIHDDLGARLTKIAMLTEQAEREAASDSTLGRNIRSIDGTAREMLSRLDETVWAINPRNDQLDRLADYILHYAEEFFRHTAIRCRLKLSGEMPTLPIAAEPRHNLFLAVKEALNNVARHSGATEVHVQTESAGERFIVTVRDNGRGFDASHCLAQGRGLENMRARVESLGGRLDFQTCPGTGATVLMEFKLAALQPPGGVSVA